MFSNAISMSSKVNQGQLSLLIFCIPIHNHLAKNDEHMKVLYKVMPIYALNFSIWAHLAPQCNISFSASTDEYE